MVGRVHIQQMAINRLPDRISIFSDEAGAMRLRQAARVLDEIRMFEHRQNIVVIEQEPEAIAADWPGCPPDGVFLANLLIEGLRVGPYFRRPDFILIDGIRYHSVTMPLIRLTVIDS